MWPFDIFEKRRQAEQKARAEHLERQQQAIDKARKDAAEKRLRSLNGGFNPSNTKAMNMANVAQSQAANRSQSRIGDDSSYLTNPLDIRRPLNPIYQQDYSAPSHHRSDDCGSSHSSSHSHSSHSSSSDSGSSNYSCDSGSSSSSSGSDF